MRRSSFKKILLSLSLSFFLVSCGTTQPDQPIDPDTPVDPNEPDTPVDPNEPTDACGSDEEYETPITDSFSFRNEGNISMNNFISATSGLAISEVKVATFTDGDTTNFRLVEGDSTSFRVRYQGINTPESTGKIQEWGIKASHFTKSKLTDAYRIVLVNDNSMFEKYDSSGGRYMGFVWYQKNEGDAFRLLNLEIVEQGYSRNYLTQDSTILDGYYEAFRDAQLGASGRRVNGEKDCDFDSSGEVVETTISNAKANFGELGIDDETASSGKMLRITGIIIGVEGSNFYVRDVFQSEEDIVKGSIYAFTSYTNPGVEVGYVVKFYAKITKFYGNFQLTDVRIRDTQYPFEILSKTEEECIALGYEYDVSPIDVDETTITQVSQLEPYLGNLLSLTVTIPNDESYFSSYVNSSNVTVFTVRTLLNNLQVNIRFESHPFFNSESTIKRVIEMGKTYDIVVILSYYIPSSSDSGYYQFEFPSFRTSEFRNYISEH